MRRPNPHEIETVRDDAEAALTLPEAWAVVELAMGSPWRGRGIPTARNTTRCVFEALREAGFTVVKAAEHG